MADPALSLDESSQPNRTDVSLSLPAIQTQPNERDVTSKTKPVVLGLHGKTSTAQPSFSFTHYYLLILRAVRRQVGSILDQLTIGYPLSFPFLVVIMLPSPVITSSTTPFSVKDILKLELQQQSQQHQLQLISRLGFPGALSQPGPLQNKTFRSHSPPSCMLAGRDSPSPISSGLSESEERMSYLNKLTGQDRLTESCLPGEMFTNAAQSHSSDLRLETEQEDPDTSE